MYVCVYIYTHTCAGRLSEELSGNIRLCYIKWICTTLYIIFFCVYIPQSHVSAGFFRPLALIAHLME